jgi:hypothetical protein
MFLLHLLQESPRLREYPHLIDSAEDLIPRVAVLPVAMNGPYLISAAVGVQQAATVSHAVSRLNGIRVRRYHGTSSPIPRNLRSPNESAARQTIPRSESIPSKYPTSNKRK